MNTDIDVQGKNRTLPAPMGTLRFAHPTACPVIAVKDDNYRV